MGRGAIILALLCFALSAFAGNRHEHLHALVSATALRTAYSQWALGKSVPPTLGSQPALNLVTDPRASIRDIFGQTVLEKTATSLGLPADASRETFIEAFKHLTLDDLTRAVAKANAPGDAKYASEVAESWFAFTSISKRDPASYQRMEDIRRDHLLHMMDRHGEAEFARFWEAAVRETGKETPYHERSVLDLSVPRRLFTPRVFNATVLGSNATVSFLLSLPRGHLLSMRDAEFAEELELVKRAVKERWGHGIDLTGSIQEAREAGLGVEALEVRVKELEAEVLSHNREADRLDNQARDAEKAGRLDEAKVLRDRGREERDKAKVSKQSLNDSKRELSAVKQRAEKLEKRLDQVFQAMSEVNGQVRVHAYEAGRDGAFYSALRKSLEKPGSKPRIRIGHAAAMNKEDVIWLGALCKTPWLSGKLMVEVSPESNFVLHGTKPEDLLKTLVLLELERVPTVIGADEQGVLGRSSGLAAVLRRFRAAGASEWLLVQLAARTAGIPSQAAAGARTFEEAFKAHCIVWYRNIGATGQLVRVRVPQ